MDRQIADLLEKQADLTKQPFIQNEITERILERTGGEGLYHEFEIDLSVAHADEMYKFSGDRMLVTQIDADASIKLNSIKNSLLDLKKVGFFKGHFKRFYLTNDAGSSGDFLKILVGAKGMFEPWPLKYPIETIASLFTIESIDLSDDISVAAAGTDTQTLQPDKGFIYEITHIAYNAPDPAGSGAGSHTLQIQIGTQAISQEIVLWVSTNTGGSIKVGQYFAYDCNSEQPAAVTQQMDLLKKALYASNENPIEFKYTNSTDVAQAGTRALLIQVKKYREASF